ncbi:hypothetical protein [Actinoplanes sp. NPDC089786]|uniref:hypothetical protein n=1 Tax=Actinoplanes sp. NPDC089786 TaxID=3155185 RepID=UPI00342E81A7
MLMFLEAWRLRETIHPDGDSVLPCRRLAGDPERRRVRVAPARRAAGTDGPAAKAGTT